ncbi:MAG: agmatinase [Theionarchaea archaeon]|nr:agmatinase [Theionarchaea archaeon]MBU7038298.1 agmatinase [Theionarchaea archaeon]
MIFFSSPGKIALHCEEEPDWILFGVPFDSTCCANTGARFGPDAIREASCQLEVFDCDLELDLTDIRVRDMGNINCSFGNPCITHEIIRKACSDLAQPFIALGGEHTVAYPVVSVSRPEIVVILDAHLDLREEFLGEPLSHACTSRRLLEICDIAVYGYRECSQEEFSFLKEKSLPAYRPSELKHAWYPEGKKVHVSFDMDVLDPSVAPNVSNPVPNGISLDTAFSLLEAVITHNTVTSMDLCEVCSRYADRTAVTAAHVLYKMLAFWRKTRV